VGHPKKGFAMTKDIEMTPEPCSGPPSTEPVTPKKLYDSPCLHEWGSIMELTQGEGAHFSDANFDGGSRAF
jgi:hypothetical protein